MSWLSSRQRRQWSVVGCGVVPSLATHSLQLLGRGDPSICSPADAVPMRMLLRSMYLTY